MSLFGPSFEPWAIMILPPGGFLCMGALLMFFAWWKERAGRRAGDRAARAAAARQGAA